MIGCVDDILRDLQSAITVRRLYPSGHPRLHVLLDDLERGARAITTNRAEFSVFAMDGRVASELAILGGGESLARGLFRSLWRSRPRSAARGANWLGSSRSGSSQVGSSPAPTWRTQRR